MKELTNRQKFCIDQHEKSRRDYEGISYVSFGDNFNYFGDVYFQNTGFGYEWFDKGEWPYDPEFEGWKHIYHLGRIEIGDNVDIHNGTVICRATAEDGVTIIGSGSKIDTLCHLAHNIQIGQNCLITSGCIIGGSAIIEDNCYLGINSTIRNKITIGKNSFIGMSSVVTKDVPENSVVFGVPAKISYRKIPLANGKGEALVDNEDYDWLIKFNWSYSQGYVSRGITNNSKRENVLIHRLLMNVTDSNLYVDHINHNTLDNRRSNLRIVTQKQNSQNRKKNNGKNSSIFKGVSISNDGKKWVATTSFNSKQIYIGIFNTEMEAAKAYDKKALELFGEYACTNEMLGLYAK